jgi:hypothetical protein
VDWVWPIWLFMIVVSFGCMEGFALATGRKTLSRWT